MAKWLRFRLRINWLRVRILLLSVKPQIWRLLRARSSLTFRLNIECGFTLKLVRDMIITYSHLRTICKKANNKLRALVKVTSYMVTEEKKKALMNSYFDSQFNYCPLVWMWHIVWIIQRLIIFMKDSFD